MQVFPSQDLKQSKEDLEEDQLLLEASNCTKMRESVAMPFAITEED